MQAIASVISVCRVLVLDKSACYRKICKPANGFVPGKSGHLRNTMLNRDFLKNTMVDAEAFA